MSVNVFVKFIALCECFTTKYKRTGTSTRYYQAAAGLDGGLSERNVGRFTIDVVMVSFMATILASIPLEAA